MVLRLLADTRIELPTGDKQIVARNRTRHSQNNFQPGYTAELDNRS